MTYEQALTNLYNNECKYIGRERWEDDDNIISLSAYDELNSYGKGE